MIDALDSNQCSPSAVVIINTGDGLLLPGQTVGHTPGSSVSQQ